MTDAWRQVHEGSLESKKRIKDRIKARLRADIAANNQRAVLDHCIMNSRQSKEAMAELLLFGTSVQRVTEDDAKWVVRYFKRLMGVRL